MAATVRISLQEKQSAVSDIRSKAEDAWSYINGELSSLVTNFESWWIGEAYNRFKEDFETTKSKFKVDIYEEIRTYADNLDSAVTAQSEQDVSNAGQIGIN
jgi:uncharacterized protein YukE